MNLKIHSYNLKTVIARCNGATIFVNAYYICFEVISMNFPVHAQFT